MVDIRDDVVGADVSPTTCPRELFLVSKASRYLTGTQLRGADGFVKAKA